MDDASAEKLISPEARSILAIVVQALDATEWTASTLEEAIRTLAMERGLKLGQVAQPIRAALTGKATSPPLFEMMALLGRQESITRLRAYSAP